MSEKRLHDMLNMHYERCREGCKCPRCSEVREALSAEPDAVAILHRWKEAATKDVLMAAVQDRLENIVLDETGYRLTDCPDCGGSGYLPDRPSSAGEFCPCMGQPTGWEYVEGEGE